LTILYLAATTAGQRPMDIPGGGFDQDIASRVNLLESFYYVADWQTRNMHRFKSFMLDSGAFTFAFGSKATVNWDEYVSRYIDYINTNDVNLFFELDIDAIVGYEKVKEIRKKIESATNKQSIPVFHFERGKEEWLRMCDEYNYVAIGGIAVAKGRSRMEPYLPWFTSEAHKRGAKVHGLGYTNIDNLQRVGFDSVDSSAWLMGNRGGFVYRFDGRTMQKKLAPKGKKVNNKAVARHNFLEWVKLGEYLER